MNTIFAQSSAPGKAGVAVFRITGEGSLPALKQLLTTNEVIILPRLVYFKKIYDPQSHELIDRAIITYFKGPASFTGEDVVEIHTHGSVAIGNLLTNALLNMGGLRLAEPGEFTKRAFLNGKFDLTAAEGLADLIAAETIWQHRQAIRQASGELEKLYDDWRQQLLKVISLLEAYIDFPDEDIPLTTLVRVNDISKNLIQAMSSHLNDQRRGELLRSGIKLAILGEPNAGKSSLLNFLMQRELAIVSNIPGTTRDIIEGHLDIGGYPIILQDTAGIRKDANDVIEREGIKRAIDFAKSADLKIIMFDAATFTVNSLQIVEELISEHTILVVNKIDLVGRVAISHYKGHKLLLISLKENLKLPELMQAITAMASRIVNVSEAPQITRERHRQQLKQALKYLENFNLQSDLVLATEDIRMTIRALSSITGKITVEEILGEIFANFCIGK